MKEYVGACSVCGREIHCHDGFLNGTVNDDQTVLCFDCYEEYKEES